MNIHFEQVQSKSQLSSYLLAALAVCTMLMLVLSLHRMVEVRLSVPSIRVETAGTEPHVAPVAIPAPLPPAGQVQAVATPEVVGNFSSILAPQVIPVPVPSVP